MSELVTAVSIETLLSKLRDGEWLVPQFQRDFVWSIADVESLIESIFDARPIGMSTLWEQSENSGLALEHVSLPDTTDGARAEAYFGDNDVQASRRYAILDGRQRCTAIAMAFGGLRPEYGNRRGAGQFFLNLDALDPTDRVEFVRSSHVVGRNLTTIASALAVGMVPLTKPADQTLTGAWIGYVEKLGDRDIYPDGVLPEDVVLEGRRKKLSEAFNGLHKTELAVYTVPSSYDLGDICEIFETLNTTGTKVSTVDLVHAWLYQDTLTSGRPEGPILLRDWLTELGDMQGSVGWSSRDDRPELVAQIVTAAYVASESDYPARRVGGKVRQINSVKAGDLLSTPTGHWEMAVANSALLSTLIQDFQLVVADGRFTSGSCPYPASASIYITLRWAKEFDEPGKHPWSIKRLNSLFRAFFWRNVLSSRYDQGFLTQIGADIKALSDVLVRGAEISNDGQWAEMAKDRLSSLIAKPLPSLEELTDFATDGSTAGAMRLALRLPMVAGARRDLLDSDVSLESPLANDFELHHIFPKRWCTTNAVGELKQLLDEREAKGRDWVNSASNLMPLSKISNQKWTSKAPGQVFVEEGVTFDVRRDDFERAFIGRVEFDLLSQEHNSPEHKDVGEFWRSRGKRIAEHLEASMGIRMP